MKGYIKIDRSFFESDEWKAPRRYSRAEALLDIQRRAMVYDTEGMAKGEVKLTMRKTANAWGWDLKDVWRFIHQLAENGRITRTDKKGVYVVNKNANKIANAQSIDNQQGKWDCANANANANANTLPFFIKDKKEKCARAREAEAVAHGAEKKSRFDSFRAWAADNIPAMAGTIDLSIWQMMLGQAYGDAVKMAKVLKAMEADGVGGTPNALLKEYERRCPR